MLIPVIYQDNREDCVQDVNLDQLLSSNRIRKFYRYSEGWVKVGVGALRGCGGGYCGLERRTGGTITERGEQEAALRESEQRFRNLVETTTDWFWEVDEHMIFTYSSPQIKNMLGYEPESFLGKTPFDLMPPEDAKGMLDALQPLFAERAPFYSLRHTVRHREGHLLTLECSAVPIFDREGRFGGYRGISRDVTERKKMEMELLKAKKLESVGALAGGIAHDFNNLLQVILGNISLAKEFETSDERIRQLLERAETASLQASDLTKRLITFSKGGTPIKETVFIGDLIRDTVLFTLSSPKVKYEFNIADDLWPVEADRGQIRQVIGNIVLNAQEAMPEGGILTILAENSEVCAEHGLSLAEGGYIKISIKDNGIGIPEENLARMFDPYFTTKEEGPQKGKGLGLAIAYSIIKKHDGLITVESQVGAGSTFFIYLPASAYAVKQGKD